MKKSLLLWLFMALGVVQALAQTRTITGKITDAKDGAPLPGVTISIKGTNTGTLTGPDGNFRLEAGQDAQALVVSFIGYETQEVSLGNRTNFSLQLKTDTKSLQEIVVTAQGIVRDKRSLGYATQNVTGDELSQKSEPNVLNALAGKVAGVNIVGSSGAPGASTNIFIRGITSFTGNNQPLIVVDGIIFSNDLDATENTLFGSQPANRLADISPESIESINILKGPAAAALYGSRASNGAIVITTKRGQQLTGKTEVTFTSSVNFQQVSGWPKLQNQYGQGINNDFINTTTSSWGPAFGTLDSVTTSWGERVPYRAYPDNVKDFFKTGHIIQNGLQLASGTADNNISLSVSSMFQNGVIPSTKFDRNSIQLAGNKKLENGITFNASINYVRSVQGGVPQGNGGSAAGQLTRIPRSFDLIGMPYQDANKQSIYYNPSQNHPLWSTEHERLTSKVDRVFGNFIIGRDITDWLNVSYRVTADVYTDRRKLFLEIGAARAPTGQVVEDQFFRSELNGDLMIRAHKDNLFTQGLNVSGLLGHNLNQRDFQNSTVFAEELTIPDFQNPSNASVFSQSAEVTERRRLVGYYGQLNFNYKDYLYLELTGRLDQSSTLPKDKNKYFYPAASFSFVPTTAFKLESDVLSYLKVRGAIARVGNDADPYLLQTVFAKAGFGNNLASISFPISVGGGSIPGFQPSTRIGSNTLTPEFTTSYEGGLNIGLFRNRVSLDATYFYTRSSDMIFNVNVSNSSGFDTRTTNVGLMTNKGIELLLNATPVRVSDFSWDVSVNFTRIRNMVKEIAPGIESSAIPGNAFIGIQPSIAVDQPYGVIIGTKFRRNDNGELLVNGATGVYVPGEAGQVIADPNPDWLGGITNTLRYKGLSLSFLVDTRQGGDIYSFGMVDLKNTGALEITAADRDQPRILPGVIEVADKQYIPNNIQISAQTYWGALGGLASEGAVFDATVYRLREISLNYALPSQLLNKTPFGGLSVGLSAHNLLFYAPHFPGDPETNSQGAGNIRGFDYNGAPNVRSYGANLRATF
ncbi:SusC/RagA family TonB-linked outer membrane protein [Chitinophaga japonensis]|uniref:TonB-linked SusC/RagA family outer membrane protein n=1 Tax=Chitinophaga japonensis TaxID=104662 RepID=A0A562TDQ0_CHIJA|nr:SusC/RagA family TonB-linked outer membrane protein [Chitinophaga japonensis]TWI91408.1 TonB-linked SusC/RagA family outer membrane protein [Chitinophaga japonensis]